MAKMHQLRQFRILVEKDWILVRRNKLWTFFEVVVPFLLMMIYIYAVLKMRDSSFKPPQEFQQFSIYGNAKDVNEAGFARNESCESNEVLFRYTALNFDKIDEVRRVMETFRQKFQSDNISMLVEEMPDESKLDETLKEDLQKNVSDVCLGVESVGGVVFDEIDEKRRVLKYRILIPDETSKYWFMDQNWLTTISENDTQIKTWFPDNPPYYTWKFLSFQHAIESSFVENANQNKVANDSTIVFQGLPEPDRQVYKIVKLLGTCPLFFMIINFINVLHISREIAAENGNVKPFLRSMGLSTPMFFSSHIFIGLAKYLIIIPFAIIPLYTAMETVSPLALAFTLFLYGIGCLAFGVLIASFFTNASLAIKASVLVWGIMIEYSAFVAPSEEHIFYCFIYGLNINGAFVLAVRAICNYIKVEKPLNVFNMFYGSTVQFSFGSSILLLIFDAFWMFGVALLVDYCRNSSDFSMRTMFCKEKWEDYTDDLENNEAYQQISMSELEAADDLLEGANEIDGARSSARAGISVRDLVKEWATTGDRAVDGLTFEAKQGQVSILLGHNGAGKSTTFESIAGIIKPTQGRVSIYGKDLSLSRQDVGLCPQYNPLYDKLTVEEHLWLVNGLKGREDDRTFYAEMNRLLRDVNLIEKKKERAMNLSGGMKRKLCVCMALIGQSNVVLLDEPTAGMDPGARKDVQDLLEREKKERTILLTTHYMDEAERLGDWILIMSHGKLVSSGTTKFLKQKYGTGYLLTVVLDVHGDKEKMGEILEAVSQFYVSGAQRGKRQGQQIEVVLPEDEKAEFPQLFKAIEAIQRKEFNHEIFSKMPIPLREKLSYLEMTSFGLSLNTLDQVFITIGDKVEEAIAEREYEGISNQLFKEEGNNGYNTKNSRCFERFIECQSNDPEKKGLSRTLAQISAVFRKKLLYTYRNRSSIMSQFQIPSIFIAVVVLLHLHHPKLEDSERSFDLDSLTPASVIWKMDYRNESIQAAKMREILESGSGSGFEFFHCPGDYNLTKFMKHMRGQIPRVAFGFTKDSILINLRNRHVSPTLVTLYNRARLMDNVESTPIIESGIVVYMKQSDLIFDPIRVDLILSPFLVLVFCLVTSSFVTFLVEERVSMFAHQQLLTGISPIVSYGVSFAFDFILFSTISAAFVLLLVVCGLMSHHLEYIILFWFIYFFSTVPFIYAVSTFFSSPSKANVLLIIWQVFIACASGVILYNLKNILIDANKVIYFFDYVLLFLLPSFSFANAVVTINFIFSHPDSSDMGHLMEWSNVGKNAICMILFGICSSIIFVVLQFKSVRRKSSQFLSRRKTETDFALTEMRHDFPICEAVKLEEQKVKYAGSNGYALTVKNLSKKYGSLAAVDNLNLTVEEKECFGLLGVNGSGKTTTFNILTGQSFATSGEARIGGRDVTDRIPIGYCPQFDAILLGLTGREVLEILGQMHGFANYREKADLVLECVGMRQNADKLVRYYSGGQKRKISVGVALLAPTQMIILDEPTAGIDPKARREVWELLIWCRENSNSALMLTSHSMDECEALCSRIGVLDKGKLIAIGTSQELKSLYGNSYTMTLTLNDPQDRDNIINQVRDLLPYSALRTPESNKTVNLVWQIPKKPDDQWSEKFEMVQSLAKQLNVKDYILSQSSLEETFLRLAGVNNTNLQNF